MFTMAKLQDLRAQKYLTLQKLAEKTGLSKSTLVDLEQGRRKPQPITRRKIADALGVSPDEIDI